MKPETAVCFASPHPATLERDPTEKMDKRWMLGMHAVVTCVGGECASPLQVKYDGYGEGQNLKRK